MSPLSRSVRWGNAALACVHTIYNLIPSLLLHIVSYTSSRHHHNNWSVCECACILYKTQRLPSFLHHNAYTCTHTHTFRQIYNYIHVCTYVQRQSNSNNSSCSYCLKFNSFIVPHDLPDLIRTAMSTAPKSYALCILRRKKSANLST